MALDSQDWVRTSGGGQSFIQGTVQSGQTSQDFACAGASGMLVNLSLQGGITAEFLGSMDGALFNGIPMIEVGFGVPSRRIGTTISGIYWVPLMGWKFVHLVNLGIGASLTFLATINYGEQQLALFGQQLMDNSYPVTLASDQPAVPVLLGPNPASGLLEADNDATVAAGGTSQIIAAVAGKTITVYGVQYSLEATAAGLQSWAIEDDSGRRVAKGRVNTVVPIADSFWIPGGFPLTLGKLCRFVVGGGAPGIDYGARVFYTQ